MAAIIDVLDLPASLQSHELVQTLVSGANAKASRVAPCLDDEPTEDQVAEAKLILVGAVKRWAEAGAGSLQSQNAGPFGMTVDTRQRTGFNLWPSEIAQLQELCQSREGKAFEVDTTPTDAGNGYWAAPDLWVPVADGA